MWCGQRKKVCDIERLEGETELIALRNQGLRPICVGHEWVEADRGRRNGQARKGW
jgi:hypothetical protein